MKHFVGGLIGGILGSLFSLMWFILGCLFMYSASRDEGGKREYKYGK